MTDQRNSLKVKKTIRVSRDVLFDCTLENGGIIAANSSKSYYPVSAKNYFYVWPRDAAYACLAADSVGEHNIPGNFFRWCLLHAEGFKESGLFYEKYYPNGLKSLMNFQPDQNGTILMAAHDHLRKHPSVRDDEIVKEVITLAANGICRIWNGSHLTLVSNDLWEERFCFPDLEENFTYSLAACIKGLRCAHDIIPTAEWIETAEEMKGRLDSHFDDYFVRSYGKIVDNRIDASVMGLVYPFEVYDADDPRIVASIEEIEKRLLASGGIHRYEHDDYDGCMHNGKHMNKGSGSWPLLSFWMSICYSKRNNREKAGNYYCRVIDNLNDDCLIPEQVFENRIQSSVQPLLWSHVMFILASEHLDLL